MQDEVEAERRRREQRQDELEQLRAENERLQERVDELEQELADTDRLASALENLGSNGGAAQDVGEGVADLQDRVDELKAERDELEATHEDLQEEKAALGEENQRLEERVADLEAEVQEVRSAFESAAEHVTELATTFEVDVDLATDSVAAVEEAGDVEDLRAELATAQERIQDLEAENERLREHSDGAVTLPTDYQDFITEDVVGEAIEDAKAKTSASPRYVKGVVAAIVQEGGPVDYDTIAERLGVSTTSDVSKAASTLETMGVLERVQQSPAKVDFDLDGVAEIKRKQQRRQQAESVMEDL